MGKAEKHHYVPKGYLRFFAKEIKKNVVYHVAVYDKTTGKHFVSNIEDVAEQRKFNHINNEISVVPTPDGNPLFYEELLSQQIESIIPQIILNITAICTLSKQGTTVLEGESKRQLIRFVLLQLMRTPKARKYFTEIGKETFDIVMKETEDLLLCLPESDSKKQMTSKLSEYAYSEELIKSISLGILTDAKKLDRFADVVTTKRVWFILDNQDYLKRPFIISDEPVVMMNSGVNNMEFGVNALDNPRTFLYMPLTLRFMVGSIHKDNFWGMNMGNMADKCIVLKNDDFILKHNIAQLKHCERQIYVNPDFQQAIMETTKLLT